MVLFNSLNIGKTDDNKYFRLYDTLFTLREWVGRNRCEVADERGNKIIGKILQNYATQICAVNIISNIQYQYTSVK